MHLMVTDIRRSIDYLETREDLNSEKLAFLGYPWGAKMGPILTAVEERFNAAVFLIGGLLSLPVLEEVDSFHYVPRVEVPVLMLNGGYDSVFPVETSQKPLYSLLGTSPDHKRHIVYDNRGHEIPRSEMIKETLAWLDKYLGPTRLIWWIS